MGDALGGGYHRGESEWEGHGAWFRNNIMVYGVGGGRWKLVEEDIKDMRLVNTKAKKLSDNWYSTYVGKVA